MQTEKEQPTDHKTHDRQVRRGDEDVNKGSEEPPDQRCSCLVSETPDPDRATLVAICKSAETTGTSGH